MPWRKIIKSLNGEISCMKKATAQTKLFNIYACFGVIICLLMLASCKRLEIFLHTEKGSDMYCVYKIGDVKNTGKMHALKKGDIICLYCAGADKCVLYTKQWIKLYQVSNYPNSGQVFIKTDTGISYLLETDDPSATCTTCPGANKFELFNN